MGGENDSIIPPFLSKLFFGDSPSFRIVSALVDFGVKHLLFWILRRVARRLYPVQFRSRERVEPSRQVARAFLQVFVMVGLLSRLSLERK